MKGMGLKTDREKCGHLLRRFGLGASEAEIDYYLKDNGLTGAIDKLLNYETVEETVDIPLEKFEYGDPPRLQIQGVQAFWMIKILSTRRPLLEKMTLFWHDHFATSAQKVVAPPMMAAQNELLRAHALGRFQDLLSAASKDPAMVFWLDNQFNVKGKPNENFAREVMELFTLGIGNYTEKDIQEAARAFTGWSISQRRNRPNELNKRSFAEFVFRENQHDTGEKSVLGNSGPFDGDAVLGILCGNPRTATYITEKVWNWFVYPNPDAALIDKFATKYRDAGLNMKVLLRAIMESPEFYSDKAYRKTYKNPVDFCVSTLRQLGVGESLADFASTPAGANGRPQIPSIAALIQTCKAMGMDILFPPDVAGWDGGASWISSATMVERIQWADRIFGVVANGPGRNRAQVRFPAYPLLSGDPTPNGIAKTLVSIFDAPLSDDKIPQLAAAASKAMGTGLTQRNANQVAATVARLIFASPEFQFA